MHGMRGSAVVFDDDPNAGVGAEIEDIPLGIIGIRGISSVGEKEDWVVHVATEANAVHLPENVAGRVGADGDGDLLRGGRRRGSGEREEWNGLIKRVVGTFGIIERRGSRRGCLGSISAVVVNGGQCKGLGAVRAFADERSHEYRRSGGQLGLDNHVGTLSNSQGHHVGGIRSERNEIVRHHSHGVVVDGESQDSFRRRVDESKTVLLARDESEFRDPSIGCALLIGLRESTVEIHFAVDQIVVGDWSSAAWGHDPLDDAEIFVMVPVVQQHRANVSVIGDVLGSVDDHRPKQAASILTRIVGMIPTGAVQIRFEGISQRLSGRDWALLDRWHPIKPGRCTLKNAMPVQGGPFFRCGNLVGHFHLNRVSPVGFDERGRKLTIDQDDAFVDSVRGDKATLDGEIVGSDNAGGG